MDALFQDEHVTSKIVSSVAVELRIWRRDGNLWADIRHAQDQRQSYWVSERTTNQMEHNTG
jgi:hypothetical protein